MCILAILRFFVPLERTSWIITDTCSMLKNVWNLFQNLSSCSIYIPGENPGILSIPHLEGNSLKDLQFIATFFRVPAKYDQEFESSFESEWAPGCVTCDFHPSGKSKVRNAGSRKRSPSYVHCASSNPAIGFDRDICSPPKERGESCIRYKKGWEQNTDITKNRPEKGRYPPKNCMATLRLSFVFLMLF